VIFDFDTTTAFWLGALVPFNRFFPPFVLGDRVGFNRRRESTKTIRTPLPSKERKRRKKRRKHKAEDHILESKSLQLLGMRLPSVYLIVKEKLYRFQIKLLLGTLV